MRGGGERGTRKWERGTALSATVPRCAFRVPTLAFSRRRPPPRVEIVLQHQRRRERIHVILPPPRLPAHLPHRRQHARRGEPLVPQRHRQPRLPADGGGELAGRSRGCAFVARSEEHTSELQSQSNLVCRLLLEKKKKKKKADIQ